MTDPKKFTNHEISILEFLLREGEVYKTKMIPIVSSPPILTNVLDKLESDGLINIKEKRMGRKSFLISLTPKGRAVAEQLKKAEETANKDYYMDEGWIEKFRDMTKNMSLLYHVNVYSDHITIAEEKEGRTRITNVYVKVNGQSVMRLWCELDESFDCGHVLYAWTLPVVQEMYANNVRNGRVKEK